MKSLRDLNKISGQLIPITDNRTPSISFANYAVPGNGFQAGTNMLTKYYPEVGFDSIVNAGPGYLDFRHTIIQSGNPALVGTSDDADIITSGYRFSITITFSSSLFSLTYDNYFPYLVGAVSWAGARGTYIGAAPLTGVGSGGMYIALDSVSGYTYTYSVIGIKNLNDWNLVKNPIINLTYVSGNISSTLQTAYDSYTWETSTNVPNPRFPNGLTAPADVPEPTNSNLYNFSRDREVYRYIDGIDGAYNEYPLFPNYQPLIVDATESTYIANVALAGGDLKYNAVSYGNLFSVTGNAVVVNRQLRTVKYSPGSSQLGTQTANVTIKKDGSSLYSTTFDVDVKEFASVTGNVYVFTSNSSFVPTADEVGRACDIIAIGGGGGAARKSTGSSNGGGAGEVKSLTLTTLPAATYTVVIGLGGARATANNTGGSNGKSTWISSNVSGNVIAAQGGRGASTTHGGNYGVGTEISGNPNGGTWWHYGGVGNTYGAGGGGAGGTGGDGAVGAAGAAGAGIDHDDFYLLSKAPEGSYARGGAGTGGTTTSGYGNGGNGATPAQTNTAGTDGLVVIRIF